MKYSKSVEFKVPLCIKIYTLDTKEAPLMIPVTRKSTV